MSGANRVTQAEWDQWDAERVERARADSDRNAWQTTKGRATTDDLIDRIMDLEARLYFRDAMLASALELLNTRAAQHARTLELVGVIVRCDEILAEPRHRAMAA